MDAYGAAAEKLANAAFRNGIPASLVTCKPSVRCRAEFISNPSGCTLFAGHSIFSSKNEPERNR
jgi:hypothetical protein